MDWIFLKIGIQHFSQQNLPKTAKVLEMGCVIKNPSADFSVKDKCIHTLTTTSVHLLIHFA